MPPKDIYGLDKKKAKFTVGFAAVSKKKGKDKKTPGKAAAVGVTWGTPLYFKGASKKQRATTKSKSDLSKAQAKKYVETNKNLLDAYNKMKDKPDSPEAKYWADRGGTGSIEAFGQAHRGESNLLDLSVRDNEGYYGRSEFQTKHGTGGEEFTRQKAEGTYKKPKDNPDKPNGNSDNPNGNSDNPNGNSDNPNGNSDNPNGNSDTGNSDPPDGPSTSALETQLASAQSKLERAALGIPYDAPSWVKTFDDYRRWIAMRSGQQGFLSTILTGGTGLRPQDYGAGVRRSVLTAAA